MHGKIGKHFSIKLDVRELQTMHELRIVQAVQAGSRADAHDPQTAEIALLQFSSRVSEVQPTLDRLFRGSVQLRLCAAVAFRQFQYLLAPFETLVATFCSRHNYSPFYL